MSELSATNSSIPEGVTPEGVTAENLASSEAAREAPSPKSLLEVTLSGAIALARSGKNYDEAAEQFAAVIDYLENDAPEAAVLLKHLWSEYISVQRSALFYEGISNAEAGLSEKMAESNIRLQQNYLRLIQEQ